MRFHQFLMPCFLAVLIGAAGCSDSGPNYVRVSGVISLDGVPYPNAAITFQPIGSKANPNPGRGSGGATDANGRYELFVDDGTPGAVPGMHTVRIRTKINAMGEFNPKTGSADNQKLVRGVEPIPQDWFHDKGGKEFEVPKGGTDKADFNIETKKKK